MTETSASSFTADAQRLWTDVQTMLRVRRELAQVEVQSDIATTKRLLVIGGVGLACLFVSLPLFAFVFAVWVEQQFDIQRQHVMLDLAAILLAAGSITMWSAWRGFRRDFVGLRDSLAEIQEDVVWLRERIGSSTAPPEDASRERD